MCACQGKIKFGSNIPAAAFESSLSDSCRRTISIQLVKCFFSSAEVASSTQKKKRVLGIIRDVLITSAGALAQTQLHIYSSIFRCKHSTYLSMQEQKLVLVRPQSDTDALQIPSAAVCKCARRARTGTPPSAHAAFRQSVTANKTPLNRDSLASTPTLACTSSYTPFVFLT